jgi:hypothetical protein
LLHDPQKGQVTLDDLDAISAAAFHAARDAHRRKGVPLVFVRDGRTLWELPDGTITDVNPFAKQASPDASPGAEGTG